MKFKGKAWTFGRNVNTDLIFPKTWFRPSYTPGEMASHLMVGIDGDFPQKVARGDIIVGGQNFGCGSSREEAAAAMKEAGVAAVVAPTFGRLFTRNAINVGLPDTQFAFGLRGSATPDGAGVVEDDRGWRHRELYATRARRASQRAGMTGRI